MSAISSSGTRAGRVVHSIFRVALLALAVGAFASRPALAGKEIPGGCSSVSSLGFSVSGSGNGGVVTGFAAGDIVTFTFTITGTGFFAVHNGGGSPVFSSPASGTYAYNATGSEPYLYADFRTEDFSSSISVTATCSTGTTPGSTTPSDNLKTVQVAGSVIAGTTSTQAMGDATGNAIGDAFGGGGAPVTGGQNGFTFNFTAEPKSDVQKRTDDAFSALAYGNVTKAPPRAPVDTREWQLWADLRGTGINRNDAATGFDGQQINVTAGLGRKITPNFVLGIAGGYETFKYDFTSIGSSLKGDGGSIGGYAGWRITPTLRWDGMLFYSRIGYDASTVGATGSFDGRRWIASTGLTGSYRWTDVILEPSARLYALWEKQDAWTDSTGTAQAARDFAAGRVSAGGRVIYPWMSGATTWSPYVGLYGDWRYSTDNALPAGEPVVGIADGWSARVTGGVSVKAANGATASIGGEYGGIGAGYKIWTGQGRVSWPF